MWMRNGRAVMAWAGVMAICAAPTVAAQSGAPECKPSGALMRLADLPEASGLVASRTTGGRFWLHNDSGKPELFAVDAKGKAAGRVALAGASLEDWEALTTGPCDGGTCLYVGDIGDNDAKRAHVVIYRLLEPGNAGGTAKVDGVFRATYPDGAHDAETLLVAPDGTLHIVTKGDTGAVALYRFPRELRSGTTMKLERVGDPITKGQPGKDFRITDGAVSADGKWVALRTNTMLRLYDAGAFFKGNWKEAKKIDLSSLREPQGEAVAFGRDGTIYLAGEGGGKKQPGTMGVMSCGQ